MSHTPGPWYWACYPEDGPIIALSAKPHDIILATDGGHQDGPRMIVSEADIYLISAAPDLLAALRDQALWIERLLQTLEHRDVKDAHGTVTNGFAGAFVPDWEMRQKLEGLREDIARAAGEPHTPMGGGEVSP